jgi:hypothetical protein
MSTKTALAELETAEFHALDALARLAPSSRRHAQLRDALAAARTVKAALLAASPDILRKGGSKMAISVPTPAAEVAKTIRETADRMAEEWRLGKRSGRRRYRAPEELRGQSLRLIDGSTLTVPADGYCEVAAAGHPGGGESAVHAQLASMRFEALPDREEEEMDVVKTALRQPLVGDMALLAFLNRNCNEELRT